MPQKNPEQPDSSNASVLSQHLIEQIAAKGPMPFAEFMAAAASHYYAAHEPFGVEGDFVTAPEVSQMFGEMIGAWLTDLWLQLGRPEKVKLIELGPGRGTLAADIMRTLSNWTEFSNAVTLHLVETSPSLRQKQAETLRNYRPTWYDSLDEVPEGFNFIIANEFFDALPVHQFKKSNGVWMERYVTYDKATNHFNWTLKPPAFDIEDVMPPDFIDAAEGSIFEVSPASLSVLEEMCDRIASFGGAGLIIDYGHKKTGLGDTVQALKHHKYSDALQDPGEKDITAHVDFGALKAVAEQQVQVHKAVTQGEFLTRLGITQRAETLREEANDEQRKGIEQALFRLIAPSEMGTLFKVMGLSPYQNTITPSGFGDDITKEETDEVIHD